MLVLNVNSEIVLCLKKSHWFDKKSNLFELNIQTYFIPLEINL